MVRRNTKKAQKKEGCLMPSFLYHHNHLDFSE